MIGAWEHLVWRSIEARFAWQQLIWWAIEARLLDGSIIELSLRRDWRRRWFRLDEQRSPPRTTMFLAPVCIGTWCVQSGRYSSVPPAHARRIGKLDTQRVEEALHAAYNPEEPLSHRGDGYLLLMLRFFLRFGVASQGALARVRDALHHSPSPRSVALVRYYGYCARPRFCWLLDLESFLLHTLAGFELAEMRRFQGFLTEGDPEDNFAWTDAAVGDAWAQGVDLGSGQVLDMATKLQILERRTRALEHLVQLPRKPNEGRYSVESTKANVPRHIYRTRNTGVLSAGVETHY